MCFGLWFVWILNEIVWELWMKLHWIVSPLKKWIRKKKCLSHLSIEYPLQRHFRLFRVAPSLSICWMLNVYTIVFIKTKTLNLYIGSIYQQALQMKEHLNNIQVNLHSIIFVCKQNKLFSLIFNAPQLLYQTRIWCNWRFRRFSIDSKNFVQIVQLFMYQILNEISEVANATSQK